MSRYSASSGVNNFVKVLTGLIVIFLIVGFVGGVLSFLKRPQGLYLTYGDMIIESTTGGVSIPFNTTASFKIENSDGWGVYSVQDCTVKIVPNVDEKHDFEFTVEGDKKLSVYSGETDLSAAFSDSYDGKSLDIAVDGSFTITAFAKSVNEILQKVYTDKTIMFNGEYFTTEYPYLALSIKSPDGEKTLIVPLLFDTNVENVILDKDGIVI